MLYPGHTCSVQGGQEPRTLWHHSAHSWSSGAHWLCLCVLLSWQIPEEHDLESQIRKEREWRFLRNARVRKQAQKIIQKGECFPLQGPALGNPS